ncbi:hypothetical protein GW17_00058362 [Ensete ventricosum]|nr:hypothetical protein GW17_00058362 [Ensete ventricosum]
MDAGPVVALFLLRERPCCERRRGPALVTAPAISPDRCIYRDLLVLISKSDVSILAFVVQRQLLLHLLLRLSCHQTLTGEGRDGRRGSCGRRRRRGIPRRRAPSWPLDHDASRHPHLHLLAAALRSADPSSVRRRSLCSTTGSIGLDASDRPTPSIWVQTGEKKRKEKKKGRTFAGVRPEAKGGVLPEAAEAGLGSGPGDGVVPELVKKAHTSTQRCP